MYKAHLKNRVLISKKTELNLYKIEKIVLKFKNYFYFILRLKTPLNSKIFTDMDTSISADEH